MQRARLVGGANDTVLLQEASRAGAVRPRPQVKLLRRRVLLLASKAIRAAAARSGQRADAAKWVIFSTQQHVPLGIDHLPH